MIDVLLFAKAPRPGSVKTRLAAAVGRERAVEIYRALGKRVTRQVGHVSQITVCYDPPDALSEVVEWLGEEWAYRPQATGDLGARLRDGFAGHFAAHPRRPVLAIGVDAPDLDARTIADAADALRRADVVIGPAADGGYYLLGMTRPRPSLLEGIPWSTNRVLTETRARCDALGLRVHVLTTLRDVDTVEDAVALGLVTLDH